MRCRALVAAALTALVALPNPLAAQPDEAKGRATTHLKAGREHADAQPPRWREACEEFQAARAEDPAHWRVFRDIGTCLMNLERDLEAIRAYERYLSDGGKQIDKNDRSEVEDVLGTLRKNLVRLTIRTDPPVASLTDSRALDSGGTMVNEYRGVHGIFVVGVRPGRHTLKIELSGYRPAIWEVDLKSGTTTSHEMRLEPVPKAGPAEANAAAGPEAGAPAAAAPLAAPAPPVVLERRTPAGVYVGLAATGALALGATATGLVALSKRSSLVSKNDGSDIAGATDLRDSARGLYVATDVLLGATVVACGITTYLYATRPWLPVAEDHARIRIAPSIGPGNGSVALTGSF